MKQLQKAILDLAVRGKLVPQYPGDQTELAVPDQRISASAEQALDARPVPSTWEVVPLSDLVRVINGRAYSKNELLNSGTPVLRVGNLFTSSHWYYSDLALDDDKYCDKGDLIYAWSASFGPFIWPGPRVIYHYHIWKLEPHSERDVNKQFLFRFLQHKTDEIKAASHGISMVHMTKAKMERIEVPVPPLAEQHRIVKKIDELMAVCDELERSLKSRSTLSKAFLVAMLSQPISS